MKSRLTCSVCGYAMRGQFLRGKHQYYLCNGKRQVVKLYVTPKMCEDWVEVMVWE